MAKTTITINATDIDGKKVRNNITYVNPEISNSNAIILAQKISSLTTDTYESTDRTDVTNLDNIVQRQFTKIQYNTTRGTIFTDAPADGIINRTTAQMQLVDSSYYRIGFRFIGSQAMCLPTLEVSSSIAQTWHRWQGVYSFPDSLWGADQWTFQLTSDINQTEILPQIVTAKFTFPAYGGYDEFTKTFTVNITEATYNENERLKNEEEINNAGYYDDFTDA